MAARIPSTNRRPRMCSAHPQRRKAPAAATRTATDTRRPRRPLVSTRRPLAESRSILLGSKANGKRRPNRSGSAAPPFILHSHCVTPPWAEPAGAGRLPRRLRRLGRSLAPPIRTAHPPRWRERPREPRSPRDRVSGSASGSNYPRLSRRRMVNPPKHGFIPSSRSGTWARLDGARRSGKLQRGEEGRIDSDSDPDPDGEWSGEGLGPSLAPPIRTAHPPAVARASPRAPPCRPPPLPAWLPRGGRQNLGRC